MGVTLPRVAGPSTGAIKTVTDVAVDIGLLFVGTKRRCAIPVEKKATWPGHAEAEELSNPRMMSQIPTPL